MVSRLGTVCERKRMVVQGCASVKCARDHATQRHRSHPIKKCKKVNTTLQIDEKDVVHPPGVEPGPIAWKAIILPLDQECLMEMIEISCNIMLLCNGRQ
jgi:hypothetical protein